MSHHFTYNCFLEIKMYHLLLDLIAMISDTYHQLVDFLNPKGRNYIALCDLVEMTSTANPEEEQHRITKLCESQSKLTLLLGSRADALLENIEYFTVFKTQHLHSQILIDALPNISTLVISLDGITAQVAEQLIYLMVQWGPQLNELQLHIKPVRNARQCPNKVVSRYMSQLIAQTSRMSKLEYLVIIVTGYLFSKSNKNQILDLPILSGLLMLYFKSYDSPTILYDSFFNYANYNSALEKIHLLNTFFTDDEMALYLKMPENLASKFAYISCDFSISPTLLHGFFDRFYLLHNLCIHLDSATIDSLSCCDTLEKLEHLRVFIHSLVRVDRRPKAPPAELPFVKSLAVFVFLPNPHQFDLSTLIAFLPSLEKIDFSSRQCSTCGYSKPGHRSKVCAEKLLDTVWKVNPRLRDSTKVN